MSHRPSSSVESDDTSIKPINSDHPSTSSFHESDNLHIDTEKLIHPLLHCDTNAASISSSNLSLSIMSGRLKSRGCSAKDEPTHLALTLTSENSGICGENPGYHLNVYSPKSNEYVVAFTPRPSIAETGTSAAVGSRYQPRVDDDTPDDEANNTCTTAHEANDPPTGFIIKINTMNGTPTLGRTSANADVETITSRENLEAQKPNVLCDTVDKTHVFLDTRGEAESNAGVGVNSTDNTVKAAITAVAAEAKARARAKYRDETSYLTMALALDASEKAFLAGVEAESEARGKTSIDTDGETSGKSRATARLHVAETATKPTASDFEIQELKACFLESELRLKSDFIVLHEQFKELLTFHMALREDHEILHARSHRMSDEIRELQALNDRRKLDSGLKAKNGNGA